jgi:two-component system, NtrC family, sensor kinase
MVNAYDKALRERLDRKLQLRASISVNAFGLSMVVAAYTQHAHYLAMAALAVGYLIYSIVVGKLVFGWANRLVPNLAFFAANTLYILATLWALEFQSPAYLAVPLMVLLSEIFSEGEQRNFVIAMLTVSLVVPIAMGAPPARVCAAVVVGFLVYWVSEGRAATLRSSLSELRSQTELLSEINSQLGDLQTKMLEQERLSSLGEMAAGVAHEINNPLAFVSSNVNALAYDLEAMAKNPTLLEEYQREVLPATLGGLARVAEIVSDLRRFARADPDKKAVFELDREVQAAVRVCKAEIDDHADLAISLEPGLWVSGQSAQLSQVLINLISNATFAMRHKRGRLGIGARRSGTQIVLTVADQGEGMDARTLSRIFEPFFTTKPQGQGTGLGLSVVHGIIRAHGGTIEASSAAGLGTCFLVRLPAAAAPAVAEPAQAA